MADLIGEDAPGRNIVAVAESAGEGQKLEILEDRRPLQQAVDVDVLRACARQLKGVAGFAVAVGAGRAEDQRLGLHGRQ